MKPIGFSSAIPILRIFDEARARDFYLDYLGFDVEFEHRFDPTAPLYMGLKMGNCHLHLSEHNGDGTPGTRLHIEVSDLEAYQKILLDRNHKYSKPGIQDQTWGVREMAIPDPFANTLLFFTPC